MIETVGLETIDYTRSRDANPRQGIDDDAVRRYADRMNAGDVFPPAVLYRVGGALLVADGLHRIAAAMAAGRDTIEAEVVDGDEVAWKEAILTSNQDHGLPWSRTERRQVVAEWLGIHPERADNWIAELAQVSKNTVAKVRQELEATCQIDRLTELMGKDGKMRPRTLAPSASGQEFEFEWVPRGWSPPPGASEGSLNAMRAQFERLHEETIGDEHYPGGEPYMADARALGVHCDLGNRARTQLPHEVVEEYRDRMASGYGPFPPIVVAEGGEIIDGAMRWLASGEDERQEVVVVPGLDATYRFLLSGALNAEHGLPLNAQDIAAFSPEQRRAWADLWQLGEDEPSDDEGYERLKASIAEHGVLVPVEYDEDGNILDGHRRVRACEELGITDWMSTIRVGLTEDEKRDHVLALNSLRRGALTREQQQEVAAKLRAEGWDLQKIADSLGVPCDEPIVDPEFEKLLPRLTAEEHALLEADILAHGILNPLCVWRGMNILLDGHARLRIAQEHGLPYEVREVDCADRDEAKRWMMRGQLGRKNLHPDAVSYLRGKLVQ